MSPMRRYNDWGNDLYSGKRSIDFVGRTKTWYLVSLVLMVLAVGGLLVRGINAGIEFTGGSDFRVPGVVSMDNFEQRATDVVSERGGVPQASVTRVGTNDVRVQTARFDDRRAIDVRDGLAEEFGVPADTVTSSVVGPSWGQSVTNDAAWALLWFLLLVSVVLAIYFRTWKMAFAALVALFHDIFITVGIYALAGFEVTPASTIGFLTILGYSMYDTVVVFDKVRENTTEAMRRGDKTFSEAANLAVNQTLVRSINTSVVALLPVSAILVLAIIITGPGTLRDLSLALFIGIAVGTYSSVFIATPLLAQMREREPGMTRLREQVERHRERHPARVESDRPAVQEIGAVAGGGDGRTGAGVATKERTRPSPPQGGGSPDSEYTATGRPLHKYARGPRNQPKKAPRAKRRSGD